LETITFHPSVDGGVIVEFVVLKNHHVGDRNIRQILLCHPSLIGGS
tara:strand:- start:4745 stop:4882 length:138 start_codon:yes stop_codon:yes gene_type:complete